MMLAHIQQRPVPPSDRARGGVIPADLDGIVLQAMAKDPADRFRTAAAMSRALESVTTTQLSTTLLPVATGDQRPRSFGGPEGTDGQRRPVRLAADDAGRARSGLRGVLGGFLLLLVLAIAGIGGYFLYDMGMAGNIGDEPATEEVTAAPTESDVTATATSVSSGVVPSPTTVPAIGATLTVEPAEPTATRTPTRVPTAEPTSVPTAEPTLVPTEVPIEPEATTDPVQIIEPVDEGGGSDDGNGNEDGDGGEQGGGSQQGSGVAGNSQQSTGSAALQGPAGDSGQGGGGAADRATTLGIESKGWKGDGSKHDKDQGWVVVAPGTSTTASFEIASVPAGESFEIEIELGVTGAAQVPLTVFLNGQEVGQFDGSLPALPEGGGASDLGTLRITLPTAPLETGKNEITMSNGADAGNSQGNGDSAGSGTRGNSGRQNIQEVGFPNNTLVIAAAVITIDLA